MDSNDYLIGRLKNVKPQKTSNMVKAELYELITQRNHQTTYSFNLLKILPGGSLKEQSHPEQHAIFLLDGTCSILVGNKWVNVQKGDFLHIPHHVAHAFSNEGKLPVDILILKI